MDQTQSACLNLAHTRQHHWLIIAYLQFLPAYSRPAYDQYERQLQ